MRFAHIADCHIGSWRDPKMVELSTKAFVGAIDKCVEKKVDFVLLAGDLFNTALPSVDRLKLVVSKLRELKEKEIPVYFIAGSHDFSPSGKTILDVLEEAGLCRNVVRGEIVEDKLKLNFTVDNKTGVKIVGMLGKKGMLEKSYYESLDKESLEKEEGYKIFMFHTALTEFKPKDLENMDSSPLSLLPKGFNYYAGGHVHYVFDKKEEGYGLIVYPGPLFPNNFKELEELGNGGFYFVEDGELKYEPVELHKVISIKLDCEHKTAHDVEKELMKEVKNGELKDKIITIRLKGVLSEGRVGDINFKDVFERAYGEGAYFVMKNTNKLSSKEFEEVKVETKSIEEVEDSLIKEHVQQIKVDGFDADKEVGLTKELIKYLNVEKEEGERNIDFEEKIKKDLKEVLELD